MKVEDEQNKSLLTKLQRGMTDVCCLNVIDRGLLCIQMMNVGCDAGSFNRCNYCDKSDNVRWEQSKDGAGSSTRFGGLLIRK